MGGKWRMGGEVESREWCWEECDSVGNDSGEKMG